jgi:AraC-like DNA-binding protein
MGEQMGTPPDRCELGYSEQTVLTRSCHRWFGEGPAAYRRRLRDSDLAALSYRANKLS